MIINKIEKTNTNFDLFSNDDEVFYVINKEIIPNSEKVYLDDELYIQDLENQFLNEIPLYKQGYKFIQDEIKKRVFEIIDIKNYGNTILRKKENYYSIIESDFNTNINNQWILPVVIDKQKIFDIKTKNSNELENKESINTTPYTENSFKIINIIEQFNKISELKKTYKNSFLKKLNVYFSLIRPYINEETIHGCFNIINKSINVFRLYNFNNSKWKVRNAQQNQKVKFNVFDDSNNIIGSCDKIYLEGEKINVCGFLVLSPYHREIIESNKLNESTNIVKITPGKTTVIEVQNSKFLNGITKINIVNSNCIPNIDGYYNDIQINNNTIVLSKNTTGYKKGTSGIIYNNLQLDYDIHNITYTNDKLNIKKNNYDTDKAQLYLFNTFKTNEELITKILKKCVPNSEQIVNHELNRLKKCITLGNVNDVLKKYNLKFQELNKISFDKITTILNDYVTNIKKEEDINLDIQNKIIELDLYSDKYFKSKFIYENYGEYKISSKNDSLEERILYIKNQKDYGELYYTYYISLNQNLFQFNSLNIVKNKIEKLLKQINIKKIICPQYKVRFIKHCESEKECEDITPRMVGDCVLINGQSYSYDCKWIVDNEYTENDLAIYILEDETHQYKYINKVWKFTKKLSNIIKTLDDACFMNDKTIDTLSNSCIHVKDSCVNYNNNKLNNKKKLYEHLLTILDENIKKINFTKELEKLSKNVKYYIQDKIIKKIDEPDVSENKEFSTIEYILDLINKIKNFDIQKF